MFLKLRPILLILLFALGCVSDPNVEVGEGNLGSNPEFDTVPVVTDIFADDVYEDEETGWIFLEYADGEGDSATSCSISNRSYVNVTYDCTCTFGLCRVKLTPFNDYHGVVSFDYSVTVGGLTSEVATVIFNVISVTDAPVANARSLSVTEDVTYTSNGTLSYPDLSGSDADGDELICIKESEPLLGTLTLNDDCSFEYIPPAAYTGNDSFTFSVNDGDVTSDPVTVQITVNPAD